MPIGNLPGGMTVDFGDALMFIDVGAIAVFLVVIYIEEIAASAIRLLKLVNPSLLRQRFKIWRAAHKMPH